MDPSTASVDALIAIGRHRLAEIAGISLTRLNYWTDTGLIRASVEQSVTRHRVVRLFGFQDAVEVVVVERLRTAMVSLQAIRKVVEYLRSHGYERPLSEIRYAVDGKDVFYQLPDGSWFDGRVPAQGMFQDVLQLDPIRIDLRARLRRRKDAIGHFERRRGALGSKELVSGTRIPVETVRRYLDAGRTTDQIIRSFPTLHVADIEAIRATVA